MKSQRNQLAMQKNKATKADAATALENIKSGLGTSYHAVYNLEYQLRKKIASILVQGGFFGTNCFLLMTDIILEYLPCPTVPLKEIYKKIADKHNKEHPEFKPLTIQNIDHTIRTGIDNAWSKYAQNNIFKLNEIFGVEFFNTTEKPTSKKVITAIVSQLILEEKFK